ncbi:MAG: hypothetical protein KIS78_35805 [Labilithrix sp.]|nr:hypothetical protein [Labilithrix sp.]MCW5837812.1 hypothetical protein [Labilithrix sp.]
MSGGFVDVRVEEHDALPDGCSLRFRAQDAGAAVTEIAWESDDGVAGTWRVEAASSDGARGPATAFAVDDSSAGTSMLIVGGDHGLRLTSLATGETVAEPYLLLSRAALVGRSA